MASQPSHSSEEGPGAREARRDLIVTWHARGHDALDGYNIPRFEDGLELTIAERIERLGADHTQLVKALNDVAGSATIALSGRPLTDEEQRTGIIDAEEQT